MKDIGQLFGIYIILILNHKPTSKERWPYNCEICEHEISTRYRGFRIFNSPTEQMALLQLEQSPLIIIMAVNRHPPSTGMRLVLQHGTVMKSSLPFASYCKSPELSNDFRTAQLNSHLWAFGNLKQMGLVELAAKCCRHFWTLG